MYGLPKNFDGSFLIGRTVLQVCFTQPHVCIYFDDHMWVSMEGSYSFYPAGFVEEKQIIDPETSPITESDLMKLLGSQVEDVHGDENGTLTLKFNNGYILECYDDPQYESYFIHDGKNTIIV